MGEDRTPPEHDSETPERRLTVADAAQELGISAEAVRSRIKRGTLNSGKDGSTVYVLLPAAQTRPNTDQTTTGHDQTTARTPPEHDQGELVNSLLDQVSFLRGQLAEEREARRRADTIIAQLTQANATLAGRVPEIEAPASPETRESPETLSERVDRAATPPEPEHPVESRSWWRRFFGVE